MAARRALAWLDGGPADGTVVETDEPEWAPRATIRVDVDGQVFTYVRVRQPAPAHGQAWRYVPRDEAPQVRTYYGDAEGVPEDPTDD